MELHEAKQALKEGYELAGFDVVDETEAGESLLRYPHYQTNDILLRISEDDVRHYADLMSEQGDYHTVPMACSLCSTSYREHLLEPMSADVRDSELRDFKFMQSGDDEPSVEIDTVSYLYVNFFRFTHGYMQMCLDRLFYTPTFKRRESIKRPLDIRYLLARPVSIQVRNFTADSIAQAVEMSDSLIHRSLFALSKEWGISAWPATEWEEPRFVKQAEREARMQSREENGADAILAGTGLDAGLVRLYQTGRSSPVPSQKFMAFFQVLEASYQENTTVLYDTLAGIINSPDFDTNPAGLQRLINSMEAYQNYASAEERLTESLSRYIGTDVIGAWLTENHPALAVQSVETIAYRLKALRDAILYAGDGAAFPAADDTIVRELPLLQYLAEEMITALAGS